MLFSEKIGKEIREKSEHRCVLCRQRNVEIHTTTGIITNF